MEWEAEYTGEFEEWWETLTEGEQEDVSAVVGLLEEKGSIPAFPVQFGYRRLEVWADARIANPALSNSRAYA